MPPLPPPLDPPLRKCLYCACVSDCATDGTVAVLTTDLQAISLCIYTHTYTARLHCHGVPVYTHSAGDTLHKLLLTEVGRKLA